jgi:hypothetical protein
MKKDDVLFRFPIFSRWALAGQYQSTPLSRNKYEAAILSVIFGSKLKRFRVIDMLVYISSPPSPQLLEKWRCEKKFKTEVEKLKGKFTRFVGENIFYGSDDFPPGFFDATYNKLIGKIYLIREGLAYDPELIDRISVALNTCLNSERGRSIENYLGYYIHCIQLLELIKNTGPKSRKRTIYKGICEKIVGQHFKDQFLMEYLIKNASPDKGLLYKRKWPLYFEDGQRRAKEYLKKGDYGLLQNEYREEFASIIKAEIGKTKAGENTIDFNDIKTSINYLAGRYRFDPSQLGADEDFDRS